jgi:hypothetical protein
LALVCNIDQRGRRYRYRIGFVFLALGVVVYALGARFFDGQVPRMVAGVLAVAGLFSIFEANRGWCAVRALGLKTRI